MEAELELPEEGELVLAVVGNITPHGVYVTLDEYGGIRGFLHVSEISTGWVRSIERHVRLGQKIVLKVIRVNKVRKEVDLSLRQVTREEKRKKIVEVKKIEKANSIMELIKNKLNLDLQTDEKYRSLLSNEFGSLFHAIEEVSKKGVSILQELNLPQEYSLTLETIAKEKVPIPSVEIRGVFEIKSNLPNGIDLIKSALMNAENIKLGGATVRMKYMGTPKYRVVVSAENYKIAEKALEAGVEKARDMIEEKKGEFSFVREHT